MKARVSYLLLPLVATGCAVGPNYKRPAVQAPGQYRGAPASGTAVSLADAKWFDLFQDETLKQLVTAALEHNFDLGIASERVLEARARFRISQAAQFPLLGVHGEGICGLSARTHRTVVVDDVQADPRYLACNLETRSEIVVPIVRDGRYLAQIDVDSDAEAAFGEDDRVFLERVAELVSPYCLVGWDTGGEAWEP